MSTETLDKLYLEWSNYTGARTNRELIMLKALRQIVDAGTTPADIFDIAIQALIKVEKHR